MKTRFFWLEKDSIGIKGPSGKTAHWCLRLIGGIGHDHSVRFRVQGGNEGMDPFCVSFPM